jgi:hypothetical protein
LSGDVITLGQLAGRLDMLEVACRRCPRRGRLRLSRLIAEHGVSASLPELRTVLAGDCPRLASVSPYDRCNPYYPQLPRLFWSPGLT